MAQLRSLALVGILAVAGVPAGAEEDDAGGSRAYTVSRLFLVPAGPVDRTPVVELVFADEVDVCAPSRSTERDRSRGRGEGGSVRSPGG